MTVAGLDKEETNCRNVQAPIPEYDVKSSEDGKGANCNSGSLTAHEYLVSKKLGCIDAY